MGAVVIRRPFSMYTATDYGLPTNKDSKTAAAEQRILLKITVGAEEEERLVKYCAENIPSDSYVPPSRMRFDRTDKELHQKVQIQYTLRSGKSSTVRIHDHAMRQLCAIAGLPATYLTRLDIDSDNQWRRELLAYNLNALFMQQTFVNRLKKPAEFLHRRVGDELRAVLTQSYNRHLVSAVVLQPFLAACREAGLKPVQATITDTRVHLQTYLPYAFQPVPGEFVALGTCWGNSDFGQGRLRISHNILRLNGKGSLLTDDAFSRVHLSSVVTDTDMELGDEVAMKELEAIAAATRATVLAAMDPTRVKKVLDVIRKAAEETVPWHLLKNQLSKVLSDRDVEAVEDLLDKHVRDLPRPGLDEQGKPLPSKWWAAAALSHVAENTMDNEQAMELRLAAGQYLKGA